MKPRYFKAFYFVYLVTKLMINLKIFNFQSTEKEEKREEKA